MSAPESPLAPPPGINSPGISAAGLSVSGPDGVAFGPLDLELPAGGVHIIQGHSGSGRTSLLLTLAGRFKPVAGRLDVLGRTSAREIRGIATIAGFSEIDDLEDSVRVRDLLNEQLAWETPWYRRPPKVDAARYADMCADVFGPRPLPELREHIMDLPELDRMLLRIALATTSKPRLLVVDDLEQVRSLPEQSQLRDRLIELGERITVVASAINPIAPARGLRVHALTEGA